MTNPWVRPKETRLYVLPDRDAFPEAVRALRGGEVVVFPTDTVYGVGCDLWQPEAIETLYWAKRRPKSLPIPVLLSAPEHVTKVARDIPSAFQRLVERFWPGGLTVVLLRHPCVPRALCAGGSTVAVRMPDHRVALRLIAKLGGALAATSANLSGNASPRTAAEALADLGGRVALVLDGGECPGGVASTIVDLVADPPTLLRRGEIEPNTLSEVLPELILP